MIKRRRRVKQTTSLQERLAAFARDAREQASHLPLGHERNDLLERARKADAAVDTQAWLTGAPSSR